MGISNSGTASSGQGTKLFSFVVDAPSAPNKRFSAYVFQNGVLKAGVLSSSLTDGAGKLTVAIKKADANGCITSEIFLLEQIPYTFHWRLEGATAAQFVYPPGCPTTAGFITNAQYGHEFTITQFVSELTWAANETYLAESIQFALTGTGLNGVSRQSACSVVNYAISNPTVLASTAMGKTQASLTYSGGSAGLNLTGLKGTMSDGPLSYACWVDVNNNGVYDSGDLKSTAHSLSPSITVNTWTSAP